MERWANVDANKGLGETFSMNKLPSVISSRRAMIRQAAAAGIDMMMPGRSLSKEDRR
jgi:hypothetical protein